MKIHKEGYNIFFILFLILAIINILLAFLIPFLILYPILIISVALFLLVVQFFRSPNRPIDPNIAKNAFLSPADGRVLKIFNTEESEYFKEEMTKVSIFMSITNVHLNRIPVSGKIIYQKYYPGKYLVAFHPKSSELNERNTIVIETLDKKRILIRQIAGALARRIRCYVKEGDEVIMGQELGFIQFGSRVDVFFPKGTQLNIHSGQKVFGSKTIMAYL